MESPKETIRVEFVGLPDKDDAEFSNPLRGGPREARVTRKESTLQFPNQQEDRKISSKNDAPYVSFGDRGTTASAGVYGTLVRICYPISGKHGSHLRSQMIGLGPPKDPEAWYVYWRTFKFLENAQTPTNGVGLSVLNALSPKPPSAEFLGDRWPLISYETKEGFAVKVRLWCQNNVVVQQTRVTNEFKSPQPLNLQLSPDFLLHDLDYQERRTPLPLYRDSGPHGYGFIVLDDSPGLTESDERVCIILGLFKDGEAQKLQLNFEDSETKPISFTHKFDRIDTVEFTVAFKLQMSTIKADWKHFMILPDDLVLKAQFDTTDGFSSSLTGDPELNWHLGRNLEHVMSVCSIPLGPGIDDEDAEIMEEVRDWSWSGVRYEDQLTLAATPMVVLREPNGKEAVLHGSVAAQHRQVALTCGDFGDHRVSVSGSYFAFMFMLAMYGKLPHASVARQRIHAICRDHLAWIAQLDADEASCSNVRIDGRRMNQSAETALPPDSPANMPSHIIKATQYLEVFSDIDDLLFVCSWLGQFAVNWFEKLVQEKNPLTPTWQHLSDSEIPVYRLSDQIWIWKALKSIEDLIQRTKLIEGKVPHETLKKFLKISDCLPRRGIRKPSTGFRLDFTAEEVRRQNLRRFALDNDVLKQRMLSVTRSARETRFLLHSRDTILYYGLEWGFFVGEETLWANLINAQPQHDESSNDQSQWDNPLRYGLAIEMAKRGHQLERTFTPSEMLTHAKGIILSSSSENGLFPGQLDGVSKEAVLFDHELFRDFYFHVGFEIPYILLRTMEKPDSNDAEIHTRDGPNRPPGQTRPWADEPPSPHRRPIFTEPMAGALPGYLSIQADGRTVAIQQTLKRQNPYGSFVDPGNIVEVPEEWLYKYPDFLEFTPHRDKWGSILNAVSGGLQEGMMEETFRSLPASSTVVDWGKLPRLCIASITDVRKGRKQRKWSAKEKSSTHDCLTYLIFWTRLSWRRTAVDSKKRLIYVESPDSILAAGCYVASPESERVRISQFFDRHAKVHASYFYDDTAAVFNSWVTEVHFRFFHIFTPMRDNMFWQDVRSVRKLKSQFSGAFGSNTYLVDAVISFRIVGDFFDRYWTCHLVENFADPREFEFPLHEPEGSQNTHWQQRKVLELILLNLILKKACSCTKNILQRIEQGQQLTATDAGEKYFSRDSFEDRNPADLREYFQLLVIMRSNVTSLQALIERWNNRESSQGRERPRWTRNDEQKYRKSINQKLAQLEDYVRDVKAMAARIEFLIALVTNAQDAIRSKMSLREAENIRLFTYVTVFFLPVSLAVSIFSMNGIPERPVIISMVVTAIVALIVTACVLWSVLTHLVPLGLHNLLGCIRAKQSPQERITEHEDKTSQEFPASLFRTRGRDFIYSADRAKSGKLRSDIEGQKKPNGEFRSGGGKIPSRRALNL